MSKEEFKEKWESNDDGGGITFDDIASCAKEWGLFSHPKTADMLTVQYRVLKAAQTIDCDEFNPSTQSIRTR